MKTGKKYLSLILAALLVLAALPAMAEGGVTRAFAVHSFVEAVGESGFSAPGGGLSAYADAGEVPPEYRKDFELAVANGIVRGSGGLLRPNDELSRLEAMIILGRCLPRLTDVRTGTEFTDVPDWARAEIDRLYRGGIVNGYGGGRLGAEDRVSPEQLGLLVERVRRASGGVNLKDDFYSAVNGDYLASVKIPEGQSKFSHTYKRNDEVTAYLVERSEALLAKLRGGEPLTGAQLPAAELYELALSEPGAAGAELIAPLGPYIEKIDECTQVLDFGRMNGYILRMLSTPVLFDVNLPCRINRWGYPEAVSGIYISYLDSGVDSSYWKENPEGVRAAYRAYAAELLSLAGIEITDGILDELSAFQRDASLAGQSMAEYVAGDFDGQIAFNWAELSGLYTGVWKNPLPSMFFSLDSREMTGLDGYVITDRGITDKVVELMNTVDPAVLRALCKLNLLEQFSDFLPEAFSSAREKFIMAVAGVKSASTAKERAARLTASIFSTAYEEDFVTGAVSFDSGYLAQMTDDIIETFKKKFFQSRNISAATAEKAAAKLDKMGKSVAGFEKNVPDPDEYPAIDGGKSFLANGVSILESISGGYYSVVSFVDSSLPGFTVNAAYLPYSNRIDIFAGILYSPIYDPSAGYEENLAGIGFTIAHEISHAFDGHGSFYNGNGEFDPWWDEADYEKFDEFVSGLDRRYDECLDRYGHPVNGKLTSDENIADILAMDCIITLAKDKGLDMDKLFRAYAASWASVCTPEYSLYISRTDTHSPDEVRVNAVLSSFDEFYETYGIAEGDGMYVPPEKRIRLF